MDEAMVRAALRGHCENAGKDEDAAHEIWRLSERGCRTSPQGKLHIAIGWPWRMASSVREANHATLITIAHESAATRATAYEPAARSSHVRVDGAGRTLPVPSPGPPDVPLNAAGGAVVSLSGALLIALVVALSALAVVVASRRQRSFAVATGRVAPRLVSAGRSGDRIQGDSTALPAHRQAEEEKRKLAA